MICKNNYWLVHLLHFVWKALSMSLPFLVKYICCFFTVRDNSRFVKKIIYKFNACNHTAGLFSVAWLCLSYYRSLSYTEPHSRASSGEGFTDRTKQSREESFPSLRLSCSNDVSRGSGYLAGIAFPLLFLKGTQDFSTVNTDANADEHSKINTPVTPHEAWFILLRKVLYVGYGQPSP